ncbi:MAG: ABC transporter substrate-binding protein [Candidatus Electrothrix communis]|nr:MAG: ABC transporter substrate-binding protein [Candidatus Electrothrix communis]
MQNVRCLLFCLLIISFLGQIAVAAAPDPTEQLEPVINGIISQLKRPGFRKESIKHQILQIKELASERFDFLETSKWVLAKKWRSMSEEERNQFSSLFAELIGYGYIGKVDDYISKEIKFVGHDFTESNKNRALVNTLLVGGGKEVSIKYSMILKGDKWMVFDIFAERVSLVRNYRAQFKAVSQDRLIPELEKLIKEMEAGEK